MVKVTLKFKNFHRRQFMSKKEYLHIRITPELKQEIAERAEGQNRTVSNYIESLIKQDLKSRKEKE